MRQEPPAGMCCAAWRSTPPSWRALAEKSFAGAQRPGHVRKRVGDRHHLVMEDSRLYVTEMSAPRFPGGPDDMVRISVQAPFWLPPVPLPS